MGRIVRKKGPNNICDSENINDVITSKENQVAAEKSKRRLEAAKSVSRMALVDKTNALNEEKSPISIRSARHKNTENNQNPGKVKSKENVPEKQEVVAKKPKYRVAPIEKPDTRSRRSIGFEEAESAVKSSAGEHKEVLVETEKRGSAELLKSKKDKIVEIPPKESKKDEVSEERKPKYRVAPIERPGTRSRRSIGFEEAESPVKSSAGEHKEVLVETEKRGSAELLKSKKDKIVEVPPKESKKDELSEERKPKYRVAPIERPGTRSRKSRESVDSSSEPTKSKKVLESPPKEPKEDEATTAGKPKYRVAPIERPGTRSRKSITSEDPEILKEKPNLAVKSKKNVVLSPEKTKEDEATSNKQLKCLVAPIERPGTRRRKNVTPAEAPQCAGSKSGKNDEFSVKTKKNTTDNARSVEIERNALEVVEKVREAVERTPLCRISPVKKPATRRKKAVEEEENAGETESCAGKSESPLKGKKKPERPLEKLVETAEISTENVRIEASCAEESKILQNILSTQQPVGLVSPLPNPKRENRQEAAKTIKQKLEFVSKNDFKTPKGFSVAMETPFKKPSAPKLADDHVSNVKKLQTPKSAGLFSLFKKPEAIRRCSSENKIFVSASKVNSNASEDKNHKPVYEDPSMTPLKRRTSLPREQKEGLYDFEIDENEPKPKKKHRPIMKIQKLRGGAKRKRPKEYVADPEAELRVLRNFDLSPSIFQQKPPSRKCEKFPLKSSEVQLSSSRTAEDDVHNSPLHSSFNRSCPQMEDCHSVADPTSSPFGHVLGSSTPAYSNDKSRFSLLNSSGPEFRVLSNKVYSPAKSKGSPLPTLMAQYNNSARRADDDSDDDDRFSVVSHTSAYQDDLGVGASTPVKFPGNDATSRTLCQPSEPVDLNVDNCFGFDEPEVVEEPLISPIKNQLRLVPPPAPPLRPALVLRKKYPLQLPPSSHADHVDVDEVIKQLRFEVGETSTNESVNLSVYDDSEISLKKSSSPMKRYLVLAQKAAKAARDDEDDSTLTEEPTPARVPRVSYQRSRTKRPPGTAVRAESSDECDDQLDDDKDEDYMDSPERPAKKAKMSPQKKKPPPKKKDRRLMTKKEEEELDKWAKMFNSQCEQVESFGLCVEKT